MEQLVDVVTREVFPQHVERTEVDLASLDGPEHLGEASDGASRRDPAVCLALAHPELARAEVPHRRASMNAIEPPLVDLDEVRDELRAPDVSLADVPAQTREQILVGQIPQLVHDRF